MNQRLVGALTVGLVVGLVVGGAVAISMARGLFGNDTKAQFLLTERNGACTWFFKQDAYAMKGNKLTIDIRNRCGTEQAVTVGNFRKVQDSNAKDCTQATVDGTEWPFDDGDKDKRSTQAGAHGVAHIKLTNAKRTSAPDPDVYYFDACIGGVKVPDPRLIIE